MRPLQVSPHFVEPRTRKEGQDQQFRWRFRGYWVSKLGQTSPPQVWQSLEAIQAGKLFTSPFPKAKPVMETPSYSQVEAPDARGEATEPFLPGGSEAT